MKYVNAPGPLEFLECLYQAWDEEGSGWNAACGPGCAACCTDRVVLTGLEARYLRESLEAAGREDLWQALANSRPPAQARPATTPNQLAGLCLARREPPPEAAAPGPAGICPLLEDGRCLAYTHRPLACRIMLSTRACVSGGEARPEPWWVILGVAFCQVAEHLDRGGVYGLLSDLAGERREGLLECLPLPGVPVEDAFRERVEAALRRVFSRPLAGRPLGAWLA